MILRARVEGWETASLIYWLKPSSGIRNSVRMTTVGHQSLRKHALWRNGFSREAHLMKSGMPRPLKESTVAQAARRPRTVIFYLYLQFKISRLGLAIFPKCYNKVMKSKIGLGLVVLYVLFVASLWFAELSCTGWGCGYSLILAIMPWPLILEGIIGFSIPLFIFLFLSNAAILYFIGLGFSKILRRR